MLSAYRLQSVIKSSVRCISSIPPPTKEIDSVDVFLKKIGRDAHQVAASKIPSWDALFTMTTEEFKTAGLQPRQRKYILRWREKFRQGEELMPLPVMRKLHGGERKRKAMGKGR